jgi:DNA-binding PadR family transcriptional regulator
MEVLLGFLTVEPMSGYDLGLTIRGRSTTFGTRATVRSIQT